MIPGWEAYMWIIVAAHVIPALLVVAYAVLASYRYIKSHATFRRFHILSHGVAVEKKHKPIH
jgi:hypothetical protein